MQNDLNTLFEKVGHVQGTVEGMDKKIDLVLASNGEFDRRLRLVEADQSRSHGKAAVIGTGIGFAFEAMLTWVGKHFHLGP